MLEREGKPVQPFCIIMVSLGCEACKRITEKFGKEYRTLALDTLGLNASEGDINTFLSGLNPENS